MNIEDVYRQLDQLYEENRGEEAERFLLSQVSLAMEEQDEEVLLQLLNELVGYYREVSLVEKSFEIGERAISQAEKMGLSGTIPFATTLLNVANAYRAGGKFEESLNLYLEVKDIYDKNLAPDSLLIASFSNNLSLLYQEMGEFRKAKEALLLALPIVKEKQAGYEVNVTYANLANTCMQLDEWEEAKRYAQIAIEGFTERGTFDSHYAAALAALGTYHFRMREPKKAKEYFVKAMEIIDSTLGKNEFYERLKENLLMCQGEDKKTIKGMMLAKEFYEKHVAPMILSDFSEYKGKIAVGLVGEGSECFGYDDELSTDHDFGPGICLWLSEDTYREIGLRLEQAYEKLLESYGDKKGQTTVHAKGRRGVQTINAFYERLVGKLSDGQPDYLVATDAGLSASVNGEVFVDEEGVFSQIRTKIQKGFPADVKYLKLARAAALFSQCGQYNFERACKREDGVTALLMLADACKYAMCLGLYITNHYPPHEKWLYKTVQQDEELKQVADLIYKIQMLAQEGVLLRAEKIKELFEQLGAKLADMMYQLDYISDIDSYLDAHTEELLKKAALEKESNEDLIERIVKLEFEAFDKVQNEGGRAECQDNFRTFSIMRKSQYRTFDRTMLLQYYYDFEVELAKGHNLITEKYGRMMESTAPEKYESIKCNFPKLTEEKKTIIEQIVAVQVKWMEEFSANYPCLAGNARSVHTWEDHAYNTSYETYLRGELSTYSDKMLELYGRYVVRIAKKGENLAYLIMTENVHLYGYDDLDKAERFLEK